MLYWIIAVLVTGGVVGVGSSNAPFPTKQACETARTGDLTTAYSEAKLRAALEAQGTPIDSLVTKCVTNDEKAEVEKKLGVEPAGHGA